MEDCQRELENVDTQLAAVELELQDLLERQNELLDRRRELKSVLKEHEDEQASQIRKVAWEGTDFPWTLKLDKMLQEVFKMKQLRAMQRQTMNATMSGHDCLLIMPTGGGKSLCFQLPSLVDEGLSLVVSPLVSLMEDQNMALEQLGVPSAMLTAATPKPELKRIHEEMADPRGKLKLLYVTPEKLAKSKQFMNRLEKCYNAGRLSRLVIDEVHCCSQWGHDFRPDYKFLGIMKRQFPKVPILGLTATATRKVLDDVKKILNIPRSLVFKASFNRPNLFYEVRMKAKTNKECMDQIYQLIAEKFRNQSGIVYCLSRKDTEEVTMDLQSKGVKAGHYHGDMDAKSRGRVHRMWLKGDIQVVVATVAFGMGIDKPDVRFVIHHTISKSMENLYQESGRAGRDDKKSHCIVFYRLADAIRQSCMVFTEQTGLANLHGITKYCLDVSSCRRSLIAGHFDEVWEASQCDGMCDHCSWSKGGGVAEKKDVTKYCMNVLTIVDYAVETKQRLTVVKLVDAWYGRGPTSHKVKCVPVPNTNQDKAEQIVAHMLTQGYLQEDFHFTAYTTICYIIPGQKARGLRNKISQVFMEFWKSGKPSHNSHSSPSTSSSVVSLTQSPELKKSSQKPKLVVVNKEKSHFNSPDKKFSSSQPSTSKFDASGSGRDSSKDSDSSAVKRKLLKKSCSSATSKPGISEKSKGEMGDKDVKNAKGKKTLLNGSQHTSGEGGGKPRGKGTTKSYSCNSSEEDSDYLNFDDSDQDISRPKKPRKASKTIEESDSDEDFQVLQRKSQKSSQSGEKRKLIVKKKYSQPSAKRLVAISDESDDDDDNVKGSVGAFESGGTEDSIVVSDDEEEGN